MYGKVMNRDDFFQYILGNIDYFNPLLDHEDIEFLRETIDDQKEYKKEHGSLLQVLNLVI